MRLRTRVLLIAVGLSLVFGGILAGALQVRAFRENLETTAQGGLDASRMLAASLTASLNAFAALDDPDAAPRAVRVTAQYMTDRAMVAVVDEAGRLLHDNFAGSSAELLSLMPDDGGYYRIVRSQGAEYQLIRRVLSAAGQHYTLYYAQDISRVYSAARSRAQSTAWLLAALMAGLACALFVSLRASFLPLRRLEAAAQSIAGGAWDARAPKARGEDEVAQLSRGFNTMAEATQQHIEALTQRERAQRQFIADMAHELKSPLTSMIGYADLMRRSNLPEDSRHRALDAIVEQGERLERMGFKLLRLARLDGGETPSMAEYPVGSLLAEAQAAVEGPRAEKNIMVHAEDDGQAILCDRDLMVSLLQNLLHNAIKASHPGGQVWLTGSEQGFTVRDEGEGIDKEHLPHVFDAFYMADRSRARTQQGAGLGLALCLRIAQLHGMTLSMESEPGQGTAVTARFTSS